MAKGNLFQGMARGKVGDVVFSRANGEQISRVRNRHPKNPRSNAQLFQRAIMATIVQAYSAGKAIFDHSFQGYSVGAQNQREFIKRNAKMLRDLIAADINTPIATNQQKGRVVAPGVSSPVPCKYKISSGTYPQTAFIQDDLYFNLPEKIENEKVSEYATRVGLIPGDIYTFVMFLVRNEVAYQSATYDDVLASQNFGDFAYIRLTVKDIAANSEAITTISQIFDIEVSKPYLVSVATLGARNINEQFGISELVTGSGFLGTGALGLIRSRKDVDLRSESEMVVDYGEDAETMYGIASDYLLDTWKAGTSSIGDSDLILEGGDI